MKNGEDMKEQFKSLIHRLSSVLNVLLREIQEIEQITYYEEISVKLVPSEENFLEVQVDVMTVDEEVARALIDLTDEDTDTSQWAKVNNIEIKTLYQVTYTIRSKKMEEVIEEND